MKNTIWSVSLTFVVFLLILSPSCKKDGTASKKNPTITWSNPADIGYGTLLSATQLNATSDVPGTFVYTPVIGTKLEVGTGQNLKVDFTPTDGTNYNSISKSVKINVTAVSTVTDIDGNVYHVVTIGTQVWMLENLNVTKYNDGTAIPNVTDGTAWAALTTSAYCNYGNTDSYAKTYGRLYNWHAVKTRKLAPTGWHVPNEDEWSTLVAFLGGPAIAGGKLKAIGSSWASPNAGATNETGFTGLPGGDRSGRGGFASDGGHYNVGEYGIWWSSSLDVGAFYVTMSYDDSSISGDDSEYEVSYYHLVNNLNFGKSVRCIKGDLVARKNPIITWSNPADITYGTLLSTTQLNATADVPGTFVYTPALNFKLNVGAAQNLKVDFTPFDTYNYNTATKTVNINVTKTNPIITWLNPSNIVSGTPLSATQLNATADVAGTFVYTPASGTVLSVGTAQNLKVDFTPTDATNYNTATKTVVITVTATVTDIDGNVYNIVTIGTQVWMKENLKTTKYNDGTVMPNITVDGTWTAATTGAYSDYSNTPSNSTTYGRLYNWYAVDNNASTKVASNGGKNVCPTSWHVPSDAEWTTLTTFLGGEAVAGSKLKETGTTHWLTPNTGATNETGFTALPGGFRFDDGSYSSIGGVGYWWSSTEYSTTDAWDRYMTSNGTNVLRDDDFKLPGFSVRCVRD